MNEDLLTTKMDKEKITQTVSAIVLMFQQRNFTLRETIALINCLSEIFKYQCAKHGVELIEDENLQ